MKSYELIAIGLILSIGIIEINSLEPLRTVTCKACNKTIYLENKTFTDWFKRWDDSVTALPNLRQTQLNLLHDMIMTSPPKNGSCPDGRGVSTSLRWTCREGDREIRGTSFYLEWQWWDNKRREQEREKLNRGEVTVVYTDRARDRHDA